MRNEDTNTQQSVTIQNSKIAASFLFKGAELCSLRQINGPELIWQADPAYWGRHASLLFPLVGSVPDNIFTLGGKPYTLPQHGFARNLNFSLKKHSETAVLFRLSESDQTLENYPCRFILDVSYLLDGSKLKCGWHVSNPADSNRELFFSIGGHPAFNCPNCSIGFDGVNAVQTVKKLEITLNDSRLPISPSLFDNGALVFEAPNFNSVTLYDQDSHPFVRLSHPGFPAVALWNPPGGAPFVCIEPWYRSTIIKEGDPSLENRKNIICLQAGELFEAEYVIEAL